MKHITQLLLPILMGMCSPLMLACNQAPQASFTPFNKDIFTLSQQNTFFRKELVTGKHSQIVLMCIPVGGDIGMERHHVDQIFVVTQGHGQVIINGERSDVYPNYVTFVPAGSHHNFINKGRKELKLFTIYAPPQHKPGTVEKIKVEK